MKLENTAKLLVENEELPVDPRDPEVPIPPQALEVPEEEPVVKPTSTAVSPSLSNIMKDIGVDVPKEFLSEKVEPKITQEPEKPSRSLVDQLDTLDEETSIVSPSLQEILKQTDEYTPDVTDRNTDKQQRAAYLASQAGFVDPDVPTDYDIGDSAPHGPIKKTAEASARQMATKAYENVLAFMDNTKTVATNIGPALDEYYNITGQGDLEYGKLGTAMLDGANKMAHSANKGIIGGAEFMIVPFEIAAGVQPFYVTDKYTQYFKDEMSVPEYDGPFDSILRGSMVITEFAASGAPVAVGVKGYQGLTQEAAVASGLSESSGIIKGTVGAYDTAKAVVTGKAAKGDGLLGSGQRNYASNKVVAQESKGSLTVINENAKFDIQAGAAFQSIREMGGDDIDALLGAFVFPMSPALARGSFQLVTRVLPETAVIAQNTPRALWHGFLSNTDAAIEWTPLVGMIYRPTKEALRGMKGVLEANPDMYNKGPSRIVRELVMAVPDKKLTLPEQITELRKQQQTLRKQLAIDLPEMKGARDRAEVAEARINSILKDMGEDGNFQFTIDQVYGRASKNIGGTEGFQEVIDTLRYTHGETYNTMLTKNRELFYKAMKHSWKDIDENEREQFTYFFEGYVEQLNTSLQALDHLTSQVGSDLLMNPAARQDDLFKITKAEMRPALDAYEKELDEAYDMMQVMVPKDAFVDGNAIRDSFVKLYDDIKAWENRGAIPEYITKLTQGLDELSTLGALGDDVTATRTVLGDKHLELKNREETIQAELIPINREIQELKNAEKIARTAEPNREAKKAITAEFEAKITPLKEAKDVLTTEQLAIPAKKRSLTSERKKLVDENQKEGLVVSDIPLPTTSGELIFMDKTINGALREVNRQIRNGGWTTSLDLQMNRLKDLQKGVRLSLKTMEAEAPQAYKLWEANNKFYRKYIAADWNSSLAGASSHVDNTGHNRQLTSTDLTNKLWTNADPDELEVFIRNFDGNDKEIAARVKEMNLKNSEGLDFSVEALGENAEKARAALRNLALNDLANKLDPVAKMLDFDPQKRLDEAYTIINKWFKDNKAKIEMIPGLKEFDGEVGAVLNEVGKYRALVVAHTELLENVALKQILSHLTPSSTLIDALGSDKASRELAQLIDDIAEGTRGPRFKNMVDSDDLAMQALLVTDPTMTAESLKRIIQKDFMSTFMDDDLLKHDEMLRFFNDKTKRQRLVAILGEPAVATMGAFARASDNMSKSQTKFRESMSQDSLTRILADSGLPLPRVFSMLNRRVVFSPSHAYLAGAVGVKILDHLGRQRTGRFLKDILENPLQLTEIDNIIGQRIEELTARQKERLKHNLMTPTENLASMSAILGDTISEGVHGYLALLGYDMDLTEIQGVVDDFFLNDDPRHQEEPKESEKPKESFSLRPPKETPEIPQGPMAQPELPPVTQGGVP